MKNIECVSLCFLLTDIFHLKDINFIGMNCTIIYTFINNFVLMFNNVLI